MVLGVQMNRAERRKLKKKTKKAEPNGTEELMDLFDKLPNACLTCGKPYDKKNKQMAMTWSVVVRKEESKVNLYCPECWSMAQKIIKDFKEERG